MKQFLLLLSCPRQCRVWPTVFLFCSLEIGISWQEMAGAEPHVKNKCWRCWSTAVSKLTDVEYNLKFFWLLAVLAKRKSINYWLLLAFREIFRKKLNQLDIRWQQRNISNFPSEFKIVASFYVLTDKYFPQVGPSVISRDHYQWRTADTGTESWQVGTNPLGPLLCKVWCWFFNYNYIRCSAFLEIGGNGPFPQVENPFVFKRFIT